MIADMGAPQIVIVELVEDCRGRPDCAVRAERPADAQAEDEIRRAGQSSLPEGGPSALQSDQLPSRYAPAHDVTSLYDKDGWKLRWYFQGGLNLVSETNLFWDFASVYAPDAKFNSDQTWLEGYVKPGIGFDKTFADGNVFYGKLSGVASRTWGTDAFDARNKGAVTLEEAYLGFRTTNQPTTFDVSLGPRELQLGSGMLIANGGTSGFDRGALKFGPRKAWKQAAIARVKNGRQTITGYFIEPNELPSNDGNNQLAGSDVRYDTPEGDFIGFTYVNVLRSNSAYIRAAAGGLGEPTIIPDGRDQLNAINLYFNATGHSGAVRNWFVTGDLAYEWNNRINMSAWAARAQIGHNFADLPWTPTLSYTFKIFSGDDPTTPKLERFDPLYYEGSPGAWATGSKSSMVFINSNLRALEVALAVQPSKKDALTLRYAYINVDKLASPIQFGQATRLVSTPSGFNLIAGVTRPHLSDDIFLEYNHVFSQNVFLTAGVSASFPGAGIKAAFPDKSPPIWSGAFVNVVVNY
ncbi:alginate export family protein [Sphingomonas olei]